MGLCLNRSPGETVVIGDDVIVTVRRVRGHRVMLEINAPADVRVDRLEVRQLRDAQGDQNENSN